MSNGTLHSTELTPEYPSEPAVPFQSPTDPRYDQWIEEVLFGIIKSYAEDGANEFELEALHKQASNAACMFVAWDAVRRGQLTVRWVADEPRFWGRAADSA